MKYSAEATRIGSLRPDLCIPSNYIHGSFNNTSVVLVYLIYLLKAHCQNKTGSRVTRFVFPRTRQMALLPECDKDARYRFSTSRTIGGRTGGFAVGLGRFAVGLPYLEAMRAQQAQVRRS